MRLNVGFALISAATMAGCGGGYEVYRERAQLVADPSQCVERSFEIYFREGQAQLTAPARDLIRLTATQLSACDIRRVRVTGLASATGAPAANQVLSERRAATVAEAFAMAGWPAPIFEVEARGAEGAVSSDGRPEPMRRRTEVWVEAASR